jgi:hypothetical protein
MAEREDIKNRKTEISVEDMNSIFEKHDKMQEKIDAIYTALMGNSLMGADSGLIARSVRTETKVDAIEKDVAQYKNMVKGMWIVIIIASAIIGFLLEKTGLFK